MYFIIRTRDPGNSSKIVSVKRTIEDFQFLEEYIACDKPYSWLPALMPIFSPAFFRGKIVYQLFHELQNKINMFLQVLLLHPTFAKHEFVWEFLLLQNVDGEAFAEKCRKKIERRKESHYHRVKSLDTEHLAMIKVFFIEARAKICSLSRVNSMICKTMVKLARKEQNYSASCQILSEMFSRLKVARGSIKHGRRSRKLVELAIESPEHAYSNFYVSLLSLTSTIDSAKKTITRPNSLIQELQSQERSNNVRSGDKQVWKHSLSLRLFDEKKSLRRESGPQKPRLELNGNQYETRRLVNIIKRHHVTLASEIGSLYEIQEKMMEQIIRKFTMAQIKSHQVSLDRLQRVQFHLDDSDNP